MLMSGKLPRAEKPITKVLVSLAECICLSLNLSWIKQVQKESRKTMGHE